MTEHALRACPACHRGLDDETRQGMGLRNNDLLKELCPGRNAPSDIDNALHNGHIFPERIALLEYKRWDAAPKGGQKILLDALSGEWTELKSGRSLIVRPWVLPEHPSNPRSVLIPVVNWVWEERQQ